MFHCFSEDTTDSLTHVTHWKNNKKSLGVATSPSLLTLPPSSIGEYIIRPLWSSLSSLWYTGALLLPFHILLVLITNSCTFPAFTYIYVPILLGTNSSIYIYIFNTVHQILPILFNSFRIIHQFLIIFCYLIGFCHQHFLFFINLLSCTNSFAFLPT